MAVTNPRFKNLNRFFSSPRPGSELGRVGLVFFALLALFAALYQFPATYTLDLGQPSDDWAIRYGFGDREQNPNFSFRWTVQAQAALLLPEIGWPNRVEITGLAPRPDGSAPQARLTTGAAYPLVIKPENASQPPARDGRLTFELNGFNLNPGLLPNSLKIESEVYTPAGDTRWLGLVLTQVRITTHPNRWGFIGPPPAQWLGWTAALSLVYLWLARLLAARPASTKSALTRRLKILPGLLTLAGFLLVAGAIRSDLAGWTIINGANVAWGLALSLAVVLFGGKRRNLLGLGLLVAGALAVFYGLVLPSLTLTVFVITGLHFAWACLRHNFNYHLENSGLLLSLTAPLGWLLWQGRMLRAADIYTYHLYWINELVLLIQKGTLYPRWTPDFVWQQGWTIFNFYPPGSRYLPALLYFAGLSFNNAVLLTEYGACLLGIFGCYRWCLEFIDDRRGAVLGGLLYGYLPYRLVELTSVGTLANLLGGALLPWLAWLLTALVKNPQRKVYWLGLGLFGAALALTSTPQLLIFLPVCAVYVPGLLLWRAWSSGFRFPWKQTGLGLLAAAGLALGLSAFYLLPGLLETNLVAMKYARASLDDDSRLWSLASSPFQLWYPIQPGLGIVTFFSALPYWLAGAGALVLAFTRRLRPAWLVLLGITAGWAVFLQFPVSRFFWQTFPELTSVQFASRLTNPAVLFAAPLVGGLALDFKSRRGRLLAGLPGIFALGLLFYACYHDLSCAYWPASFDGSISRRALSEQIENADPMYLPKGADLAYITAPQQPRFEDSRLAANPANTLRWEITGSDSYRLTSNAGEEAWVNVPIFWFDGWWAVADETGRPYPLQLGPAALTQHLRLKVAPGRHSLNIKLQDTPVRLTGNGLTILAMLLLVIGLGWWVNRRRRLRAAGVKVISGQAELADESAGRLGVGLVNHDDDSQALPVR